MGSPRLIASIRAFGCLLDQLDHDLRLGEPD
jgi:hypothetical protein